MKNKWAPYSLLLICFSSILSSCVSRDDFTNQNNRISDLEKQVMELEFQITSLNNEVVSSSKFEKEMACQDKLDQLKKRWNNIVGCYYSSSKNTCIVRYKKNGKIEEAPIERMEDI